MSAEIPDRELIERYRFNRDEAAARQLLQRHYKSVFDRLKSRLTLQDAEDCSQKLWTRFFNNIDSYVDSDRFEHYLSKAISNTLKEQWRNNESFSSRIDLNEDEEVLERVGASASGHASDSPEAAVIREEEVNYLVDNLIPGLAPEQRLVWLLTHESEFWDPDQPMSWDMLARLNGIDPIRAWSRFQSARKSLMGDGGGLSQVDAQDLIIFMVWSQSQRPEKKTRYTLNYFADLLGESENTLKTRYRKAKSILDAELLKRRADAGLAYGQ